MKLPRMFAVLAAAAMALMAFASTASATTLATNGVTQTGAVTLEATLTTATSVVWRDTSGTVVNTCTSSKVEGTTSVFTGTSVSGPLSTLTFEECTGDPVFAHKTGTLSIERIGATANGTVRSNGTEVTVPTGVFGTVTCKTSNTDIGTLTGSSTGTAEIDVKAILNCGIILPSAPWEATYVLTVPNGIIEDKHHISVVV